MLNTTLAKLPDTNMDSYCEVRKIGARARSLSSLRARPSPTQYLQALPVGVDRVAASSWRACPRADRRGPSRCVVPGTRLARFEHRGLRHRVRIFPDLEWQAPGHDHLAQKEADRVADVQAHAAEHSLRLRAHSGATTRTCTPTCRRSSSWGSWRKTSAAACARRSTRS